MAHAPNVRFSIARLYSEPGAPDLRAAISKRSAQMAHMRTADWKGMEAPMDDNLYGNLSAPMLWKGEAEVRRLPIQNCSLAGRRSARKFEPGTADVGDSGTSNVNNLQAC
jgi:hypothetical protein